MSDLSNHCSKKACRLLEFSLIVLSNHFANFPSTVFTGGQDFCIEKLKKDPLQSPYMLYPIISVSSSLLSRYAFILMMGFLSTSPSSSENGMKHSSLRISTR